MIVAPGTTSQSIDIQIVDDTGLAVPGLVAATLPAISWSLAGPTAATSISLSDLALITTAYSSGGVKERSGGYYRLDLPNTSLASAGNVRLIGEAPGKHLICEPIVVAVLMSKTYDHGSVWVDTVDGVAGGVPNVNGLPTNPVSNMTDANTLAAALGLNRFVVAPSSVIVLATDEINKVFDGDGWDIQLQGIGLHPDISGTIINSATISGSFYAATNTPLFNNCTVRALLNAHNEFNMNSCLILADITLFAGGPYDLTNCICGQSVGFALTLPAAATVSIDLHHFYGKITIKGMITGDTIDMSGSGTIILDSTCTGGTINIEGNFTLTNNGTGVTINDVARYDVTRDGAGILEGTLTRDQARRITMASSANKTNGSPGTSFNVRDVADLKNRIAATVDANGNRTAVTLDGT